MFRGLAYCCLGVESPALGCTSPFLRNLLIYCFMLAVLINSSCTPNLLSLSFTVVIIVLRVHTNNVFSIIYNNAYALFGMVVFVCIGRRLFGAFSGDKFGWLKLLPNVPLSGDVSRLLTSNPVTRWCHTPCLLIRKKCFCSWLKVLGKAADQ